MKSLVLTVSLIFSLVQHAAAGTSFTLADDSPSVQKLAGALASLIPNLQSGHVGSLMTCAISAGDENSMQANCTYVDTFSGKKFYVTFLKVSLDAKDEVESVGNDFTFLEDK